MDITSGSCLPSTASMLHITCRGGGMAALGRTEEELGGMEGGLGRMEGGLGRMEGGLRRMEGGLERMEGVGIG